MPENPVRKPVRIGILGAGVSGLSAAYFLQSQSVDVNTDDAETGDIKIEVDIYEAADQTGGLARSFKWHGIWCDIAPHRLYTQDKKLLQELMRLVPMHEVKRSSKIFIRNKWINDPVNPFEILLKFFPKKSLFIFFSYVKARLTSAGDQSSFEGMVLSRFGSGLNEMFFKPYSEKLFGIPANKISAEWAKRKIRISGVKDMLKKDTRIYFKYFYYPDRGGYGAISQKLYQSVAENVHLQTKLTAIKQHKDSASGVTQSYTCSFEDGNGKSFTRDFDILISTLPLNAFSQLLGLDINLAFRPARLVYLNVNKSNLTGMHWFYVADAAYRINRVAEFKNFSLDYDAADNSVICVEVTAQENFSVANVISELERLGTLHAADVIDTKIIDVPSAYPIYDLEYSNETGRAFAYFKQHPNLYLLGRNAQFSHVDVDEIFGAAKQMTKELVASLS